MCVCASDMLAKKLSAPVGGNCTFHVSPWLSHSIFISTYPACFFTIQGCKARLQKGLNKPCSQRHAKDFDQPKVTQKIRQNISPAQVAGGKYITQLRSSAAYDEEMYINLNAAYCCTLYSCSFSPH